METPCKIATRSNGRINNYNYYRETGQLCSLRQNPNLIVFLLPGLYHYKIHTTSVNQYYDAFLNFNWPEILTQGRKPCLDTHVKFQFDPTVELGIIIVIAMKLDSCAVYVRIRI